MFSSDIFTSMNTIIKSYIETYSESSDYCSSSDYYYDELSQILSLMQLILYKSDRCDFKPGEIDGEVFKILGNNAFKRME